MTDSFSQRYGIGEPDVPITIRTDAPVQLRNALWALALKAGADVLILAKVILDNVFYPHYDVRIPLAATAQDALNTCLWNEVYDAAERIYQLLDKRRGADQFERDLNTLFHRSGIGWKMMDGLVHARGSESVEYVVHEAAESLKRHGRETAEGELREAIRDLSRRPQPDTTGAVQHAGAALECVARDVTKNPTKTFGDVLRATPSLFPKPLDEAASKFWGYVSTYGRHVREGHAPTIEEAFLTTGIAAALAGYLTNASSDA